MNEQITLDPFNELPNLRERQERQFKYLKKVRHLIDSRISDTDIMMLYDYGIDAVMICSEKIKQYE